MVRRPAKEEYYLGIAREVARRGTCMRRNFGAVIVNNDQIISSGYTGAPRGSRNCIDIGYCPREANNVPRGEKYELCRSVHAEMNAIIHAARSEMRGGTLYLVGLTADDDSYVEDAEPCKLCKRVIINAGLERVIVRQGNDKIATFLVESWVAGENIDMGEGAKGY
jgi:dCMP deaminase